MSPDHWVRPGPDEDDPPLTIRTASSADGSVVALWSPPAAQDPAWFVILYHLPSNESWPRLLDTETSSQPAVQAKWRARYALLRATHGDWPAVEKVIR